MIKKFIYLTFLIFIVIAIFLLYKKNLNDGDINKESDISSDTKKSQDTRSITGNYQTTIFYNDYITIHYGDKKITLKNPWNIVWINVEENENTLPIITFLFPDWDEPLLNYKLEISSFDQTSEIWVGRWRWVQKQKDDMKCTYIPQYWDINLFKTIDDNFRLQELIYNDNHNWYAGYRCIVIDNVWYFLEMRGDDKEKILDTLNSFYIISGNATENIETWYIELVQDERFYENTIENKATTVIISWDDNFWSIKIPSDWLIFRNEKYGFQVKIWEERSGGKFYDSWTIFIEDNNSGFYPWKLPIFIFAMPSLSLKIEDFHLIMYIVIYTYDEYQKRLLYEENMCNDDTIDWCSLEEFKQSIIWKNNKYYVSLERWNAGDEFYKKIFPFLECRKDPWWDWDDGLSIMCDGYEEIDWERVKTWKDWVEQLFPEGSFEFFDVE